MTQNTKVKIRNFQTHKKFYGKPQKAFTLVEITLYIALVSIFIIVLTDIFTAILSTKIESETRNAMEQDSRFIIARLSYDIRRATQITVPANPGQQTPILTMIAGIPPSYNYSLQNGNLKLGGLNLNSSETQISNISFKKIGNAVGKETITFEFTIESKTSGPQAAGPKTFKTTVGRRR